MWSMGNGEWKVDISNDNGQTWVNVSNTREGTNDWERIRFKVADYVPATDSVQLRFIADNFFPNAPSLVEALVDDFQIFAVDSNITAIDSTIATLNIPRKFELSQNYPNPFNPSTAIKYSIPKAGFVTLVVYDVLGSEVSSLVNEEKTAGYFEIEFDGSSLASGIYFYRLQAGDFVETKKMMMLK
ncbi:MAG: T9SS type A sorting domain-containing protein [Bacteroidetes bacterium]|nr:T9SS type A sorting domain-containing protein [Bacteroidota bacterium]